MKSDGMDEISAMIEEYRDRCLWFLAPGYTPSTPGEVLWTLDLIERYGDRAAFQRAERLKQRLRQPSNAPS